MGILDKLIKAVFKTADKPSQQQNSWKQNDVQTQSRQNPVLQKANSRENLAANLREILSGEYPCCEVQENVSVQAVDPSQTFGGPIDFALLSDGKIICAIMIIEKNKKRTKRVHGVELACKNTGTGFANFYTTFNDAHFPFSREHAVAYLKRQIR